MKLDTKEITSRLGVSRQTLHAWIREGSFPKPNGRRARRNVWDAEMVESWIKENMSDRTAEATDLDSLPPAMAATVDEFAAALVGLNPEAAWERMFRMANRAAELLSEANPDKHPDEIRNLVAIYSRCVRRRALQLEEAQSTKRKQ